MKNRKSAIGLLLSSNIDILIQEFQLNIVRLINYKLINLFWTIGQEINKNSELQEIKFKNISKILSSNYGEFFIENDIKLMSRFAETFSRTDTLRSASDISWSHINVLAGLKDSSEILFYCKLTYENDLTVTALKTAVEKNTYNQTQNIKEQQKYQADHINKGVIGSTLLQQLPQIQQIMNSVKPTLKEVDGQKAGLECMELVEEFKQSLNRRINTELNKLFWNIGTEINNTLQRESNTNENEIFEAIASRLSEKHSVFTKNMIADMTIYAEQITDVHLAHRLNKLIDWNHIRVLLPLKKIEEKYFYARLAASQGLPVLSLKSEIEQDRFQKTHGAKEIEQETISTIQNPIKRIIREESKNMVITGTEYSVSYGHDIKSSKAISNFFKDSFVELLDPILMTTSV